MAESRGRYPPEYREQIVELVRGGRRARSLAREFEPSEQTIRNWVKQADLDEGPGVALQSGPFVQQSLAIVAWSVDPPPPHHHI